MGVAVKEERVILEVLKTNLKVAELTYSTHFSIDTLSTIGDSSIRKEIVSYQQDKKHTTIEKLRVYKSADLYYTFININHFLKKSGYSNVSIFVTSNDSSEYEELGFTKISYIIETDTWFMVSSIKD